MNHMKRIYELTIKQTPRRSAEVFYLTQKGVVVKTSDGTLEKLSQMEHYSWSTWEAGGKVEVKDLDLEVHAELIGNIEKTLLTE